MPKCLALQEINMIQSTKIALTYATIALIMAVATGFLVYEAWEWQPPPNTMAHDMRLVALIMLPLLGLSQVIQITCDPLAWRVILMLRRKERQIAPSS